MLNRNKTTRSRTSTGLLAVLAALIAIILGISPIFSKSPTSSTSLSTRNQGLFIYHRIWENTRDYFVFTERLKDWSKWEHKFDDKIKSKADGIKYSQDMLKSLNDVYTRVLNEEQSKDEAEDIKGNFVGIGVRFASSFDEKGNPVLKDEKSMPVRDAAKHPIILKVLTQTPASAAGLKDRDAIVSVNGKSTVDVPIHDLTGNITGPEGSFVTLKIQRGSKLLTFRVQRRKFDLNPVTYHTLPDNLGYIRIDSFIAEDTPDECLKALKALKNCRGYVLDLRNNLGGLMVNAGDVMALFLEKGVVCSVRERQGDRIVTGKMLIGNNMPHIAANKPLVILVDNETASASEILSGGLHDNRHVKLVGTQTFGKGLVQIIIKITDDVRMHVTMAQWLTPNGTCPGSDPKTKSPNGFVPEVTCNIGPYWELDSDKDNQLQRGISVLKEELSVSK